MDTTETALDVDVAVFYFICLFCGHAFGLECAHTPYCSPECVRDAEREGSL